MTTFHATLKTHNQTYWHRLYVKYSGMAARAYEQVDYYRSNNQPTLAKFYQQRHAHAHEMATTARARCLANDPPSLLTPSTPS